VVPYTRGAEYSRDVGKIYDDALRLANQGVKEIYLLGQNVNAYHGACEDGSASSLAKLIEKIATIPQIERIRYTTSHPRDMSDDLIAAHRDISKLMPFLHLPVQSGSNNVLKGMNRKHTRQDYFKIIEKLRNVRPEIGLSSDFIVGFPGETEGDYNELAEFITAAKLDAVGIFGYSDEDNTEALDLSDKVEEEVIRERVETLSSLADEMVSLRAQARIGESVRVLIEDAELQEGRAAHQGPEVDGTTSFIGTSFEVGQYIDAVVIDSMGADLVAEVR